ncbi:MAG: methionine synthase, partial [Bacteroidetes bacterium]|nr:methionine synthase [Bacteroidota bacterium]
IHTAVKIAPAYRQPVIHVRDASKVTSVIAELLSTAEKRDAYIVQMKDRYEKLTKKYRDSQSEDRYLNFAEAKRNRFNANFDASKVFKPKQTGIFVIEDQPLEELVPFIDWTFFFHSWRLSGKYPQIFDDPVKGEEAKKIYADARQLLDEIVKNKSLKASGVAGIFPAKSEHETILVYEEDNMTEKCRFEFLRNQQEKKAGIPNLSLTDFIAPTSGKTDDYLGAFVVTAGHGAETLSKKYEQQNDDYNAIMVKVLADRLAEAFAEFLHHKVRRELWGYDPDEQLTLEEMLSEGYQGIRPAPGYPACPEHSEKEILFELLSAEKHTGVKLTENFAMTPPAAVSGFYFAHPDAQYFNIGKVGADQINDYAKRKKMSNSEIERLLNANLNYR